MFAVGGAMELIVLCTAGFAFLYFIFEPLVCWVLVFLALAVKAMFK